MSFFFDRNKRISTKICACQKSYNYKNLNETKNAVAAKQEPTICLLFVANEAKWLPKFPLKIEHLHPVAELDSFSKETRMQSRVCCKEQAKS